MGRKRQHEPLNAELPAREVALFKGWLNDFGYNITGPFTVVLTRGNAFDARHRKAYLLPGWIRLAVKPGPVAQVKKRLAAMFDEMLEPWRDYEVPGNNSDPGGN